MLIFAVFLSVIVIHGAPSNGKGHAESKFCDIAMIFVLSSLKLIESLLPFNEKQ